LFRSFWFQHKAGLEAFLGSGWDLRERLHRLQVLSVAVANADSQRKLYLTDRCHLPLFHTHRSSKVSLLIATLYAFNGLDFSADLGNIVGSLETRAASA
jgi:hypothetical protein